MCRRLIALFALHFFLSVSAFAFGSVHQAPVTLPHTATMSQATPAEAAPQHGEVVADSAMNHALVDEVPDLPDSLPRNLLGQRSPADSGRSIGYRQLAAMPLSLDGLLRPPQQAVQQA